MQQAFLKIFIYGGRYTDLYLIASAISNPEVIQIGFRSILCGETGVHQEALFIVPFFEAPVVEQLWIMHQYKNEDSEAGRYSLENMEKFQYAVYNEQKNRKVMDGGNFSWKTKIMIWK